MQRAGDEANRLTKEGPKRDRLLYYLEEGAVARMQGDRKDSILALNNAAREYDRWFGPHLRTETKISEELLSTLGSAELKPYKSRIYERVMLRTYQAHNYLLEGDRGRARAQVFKTRQAIQDSKDIWKLELDSAREQAKKHKIDLSKTLSNHGGECTTRGAQKYRVLFPRIYQSSSIQPLFISSHFIFFMERASGKTMPRPNILSVNSPLFILRIIGLRKNIS